MAYHQLASIYDIFMDEAPYDEWVHFTSEAFQRLDKNINHIVDLGCGTGEITIQLAKKGFHMIGVDYSTEMLSIADQKAASENLQIDWLCQDLRTLEGLKNLDAAISFCDVINYITDENELKIVFQHIYDALNKDGLFLFDIHSLYHVEHHLVEQTFANTSDDSSYIWFCATGDEEGEMHHELIFFVKEGELYRRFDEWHHQRTYPVHVYKKILKEAGFTKCHIYGDFSLETDSFHQKTERIFFIAQK